jgi:two-component system, NtrC family, sensor histidine kinase HydH
MLLAFINSREALLAEIQRNLGLSASAVSADVDKQLFERLINATSWNHLEVMEDLRLGDVDKRLSRFLSETKERHGGVYIALHALRPDGVVVASSRPAAIGQALLLPPHWMTV